MGQWISTQKDEALRYHNQAELQLKKAKRQKEKEAKILLLGPGDSGKTTIMKQMRLIAQAHFSLGELESYRQLVFANLISGMGALVEALPDVNMSIEEDAELKKTYQLLEMAPDLKYGEPFPQDYLPHFRFLWQHPIIREGLARCHKFAIPDNVTYFYSALDRLFRPDYRPTNQDIVQTRARTVGIVEAVFTVSDAFTNQVVPDPNSCPVSRETFAQSSNKQKRLQPTKSLSEELSTEMMEGKGGTLKDLFKVDSAGSKNLRIVDVGGQKSERRKWIHSFSDVTAILFLVPLSGYDQCLVEERNANQMTDAMTVWEGICTMEWFQNISLILFLNKEDLFDAKIKHSPIRRFFPDFDGESKDAEAGKEYFKRRFLRIAQKGSSQYRQQQRQNERQQSARPREDQRKIAVKQHRKRQIYVHYTTAVNTSLIRTVMSFVADTVIRSHLASSNLL